MHRDFQSNGYDTVVLLPTEEGDAADILMAAGVKVLTRPLYRLRATYSPRAHLILILHFMRQVSLLQRVMEDEGITLLQIHGLTSIDGLIAGYRSRIPVIWQILDTRPPRILRLLLAPFYRLACVVMTTGTTILRAYPLLQRHGHIETFYPPVSGTEFAPDLTHNKRARHRFGILDEDVVIVCVANMNPQKDHRTLLRAVATLTVDVPVRLLIRGSGSARHRDYFRSLERLRDELGLRGDSLALMEADVSTSDVLHAGNVFCLTSTGRSEGVPTVVLEAMAVGLPVVASEVGGVAEAVTPDTGRLVPPNDPQALAAPLAPLLNDAALRAQMGAAARRRFESEFSFAECLSAHIRAYDYAVTAQP
jgi:glycosyltransferase involved in cell wall biosynthesis